MISEYARMIAIKNLADLDCFMEIRKNYMEDKINPLTSCDKEHR